MKVKTAVKQTFRFIGAVLALIRAIMILAMIVVAVSTVYLIYTTGRLTIVQYNETLEWDYTAYEEPLASLEPSLVVNQTSDEAVQAAAVWDELDKYVNGLDELGITDQEYAQQLAERASACQEAYGLNSDALDRLELYLELDNAIEEAYTTLDTSKLQELSGSLYTMELENLTETGQMYLQRLRQVSEDFKSAKQLMENTVWSIGTIEDGVWTIPYTYERSDLTEILEQINGMTRFQPLRESAEVMTNIASVLNQNKNARDYFAYQEFKESIDKLTRSNYVSVSSIYTYGQAVAYGCRVTPKQVEGFTISLQSPVTGLYYNGERLDDKEYFRKGAVITAEIKEIYEPISEESIE